MAQTTEILVDPHVSRLKFDRELDQFRQVERDHYARGWFLVHAEFPEVFVVFAAPQLKPPAVVFGAILNFANYDFRPPSVRLVNPFTTEPYKAKELPTVLRRRLKGSPESVGIAPEQQLMQAYSPDDLPFLCIPGVREYHDHPAHSGDDWLIHRKAGEGSLYAILSHLYKYGIEPLSGYNVQLQVAFTGFEERIAPE